MRITKVKWRRLAQAYLQAAMDCEGHGQSTESDYWGPIFQFSRPPPPDVAERVEQLHREMRAAISRRRRLLACATACYQRGGWAKTAEYIRGIYRIRTWSQELSGGKTHAVPDQG